MLQAATGKLLKRLGLFSGVLVLSFAVGTALPSCTKQDDTGSVMLRKDVVTCAPGSLFIEVKASGPWQLSLIFSDPSEEWASLGTVSGTGSSNNIILEFEANESEFERSVTIVLVYNGGKASAVLTQSGSSSGTQVPDDPDWPGLVSDGLRQWMELPAMETKSGFAWVFHNMNMDGKEFRNYSLYYDAGNRLSRWVAYPLNTKLNGSGSRNDQFEAVDPKIPYQYQPYTAKGWGVSGYDRGHQIPAADRYWTDAHRATFYPTNMTVQKSELNQRIWADLESKVRSWAGMCDTLYVVTGCVPGPEFITDRGGNQVNVPSAYYKALLRYDASSTIAKYMGVAFWFENREYSDAAIKDQAMTVDELESRLGMDFFVNLPDQYEQEAESTINAWWNLN